MKTFQEFLLVEWVRHSLHPAARSRGECQTL